VVLDYGTCRANLVELANWYEANQARRNVAENSMRPLVLGRKNWIHIGSQEAGPKVAAIVSIVESCRRLQIPLRDYLATVLPGLAHRSIQTLISLTPAAWATSRL
jgi:transposase